MRIVAVLSALCLGGLSLLAADPAPAAALQKGMIEIEGSVPFDHTSYSESSVGSRTNLDASVGAAYSFTSLLQAGGGITLGYLGVESDAVSASGTAMGLSADLTANFATPTNLVPFLRAGAGFQTFSGDAYVSPKTSFIAPYVRAGVRAMVVPSASVNLSVAYQHVTNADGEDGLDANSVSFAAGLSIFFGRHQP